MEFRHDATRRHYDIGETRNHGHRCAAQQHRRTSIEQLPNDCATVQSTCDGSLGIHWPVDLDYINFQIGGQRAKRSGIAEERSRKLSVRLRVSGPSETLHRNR
ncbi:MAG: hypothetical protein NVS3B5_23800 [Sphingomicrobium sp.]